MADKKTEPEAPKMRRICVYLDKKIAGAKKSTHVLEVPFDMPEKEVEQACQAVIDSMIECDLHVGWYDLEEGEKP